ncbi:MAG: hypothetical protein RLZZ77_1039 [Bacteroidota bacterium]
MKKIFTLSIVLLALVLSSKSQLVISNTMTVQQYVQDVLLGPNITATNITFNGQPANGVETTIGSLDCIDCNLGIQSGFIMSTGSAASLVGPNNVLGSDNFNPTATSSDPDLNVLADAGGANSSALDWSIIEFDFVPLGDTLRFNYIWASEEYPDFTAPGTVYNDFFGFFLSGPGINGTFANNAINIALIPGTDIPVGIGTLNNGTSNAGPCNYCEFYNQDYTGAGGAPIDTDECYTNPYYANADGYTDVLTAIGIVQCGLTYHIKLAVADGYDASYNSYVILERESFTSNLVIDVALSFEAGGPNDDTVFEDCGSVDIVFSRPETGDPNDELIAYLDWGGVALEGADYLNLPDSLVFAPGMMSIVVPFDAIQDNIVEGIETVDLTITNFAVCSGLSLESSYNFFVSDTAEPIDVVDQNYTICEGATQLLEPVITGGYGNYSYSWSTTETTETINVTPSLTTTYVLTVSDTCGLASSSGNFVVSINDFDPLAISIDQGDQSVLDCGGWVDLTATATGGDADYTYDWTDENGNNLWGWQNSLSYFSWNGPGLVNITVTDGCGFTATDAIDISINSPAINVILPPSFTVGCNDPFNFTASVSGGTPSYFYSWSTNGVMEWDEWDENYDNPGMNAPGEVTLVVSDNCGQETESTVQIIIDSPAIFNNLPASLSGTCLDTFTLDPAATGGTGTFSYIWNNNGTPLGTTPTVDFTTMESTQVSVTITDECSATSTATVDITLDNPAITVTTTEDQEVTCLDQTVLNATAADGTGTFEFEWIVNGQVVSITDSYTIQTGLDTEVIVNVTDYCGSLTSESIMINVPNLPINITATPDTSICEGTGLTLTALASGGLGDYSYLWSPNNFYGADFTISAVSETETYTVTATDVCGNYGSEPVTVYMLNLEAPFTYEEVSPYVYEFVASDTISCIGCQYAWDFGDGATGVGPVVTHGFEGIEEYQVVLHVISPQGCEGENFTTITSPPQLYIPNSFSPNGDGVNDVWRIVANSVETIEIYVFNRWGDVIFTANDANTPWVADSYNSFNYFVEDGVYPFFVKAWGYNNEVKEITGNITIFR